MASIRSKQRADGSTVHRVYFRHDGKQTCFSFDDLDLAETFKAAANRLGAARAIELHSMPARGFRGEASSAWTVESWVKHHIDHLIADKRTKDDYRGYLRNDIAPMLGPIPLDRLSADDVKLWVMQFQEDGAAAKTISNKHGFLSGALNVAVERKHIAANPAAGTKLPRGIRPEMVFLSHDDFTVLLAEIPEYWRPLVEFLVVSGCRWGEATALYPGDVDRRNHTVNIRRAWKRQPYRIGTTKTKKSDRIIKVPASVLAKLDYSREYLFTNPGGGAGGPSPRRRGAGGPVRAPNFRANVWWPATARAKLNPRPRIHDLRHTCASWLIAGRTPLPVIQKHLGHESIQTTVDVYGHLDMRSAQEAADVMSKLLD
jgi:integrase